MFRYPYDWKSLTMLLAGTALAAAVSLAIALVPSFDYLPVIFLLLALSFLLILYGVGVFQSFALNRTLRARWRSPLIGILSDNGWPPDPGETRAWTEVLPTEWRKRIEQAGERKETEIRLTDIRVTDSFNKFAAILNPYGSVYPENDLTNIASFWKILDFVKKGGLFISVADTPLYYAYSATLKRRIAQQQFLYIPQVVDNAIRTIKYGPYDDYPFAKETGFSLANVDRGRIKLPRISIPTKNYEMIEVEFTRAALIEFNVTSALPENKSILANQEKQKYSPIVRVGYGDGDFLVSLVWLSSEYNKEKVKLDALIDTICDQVVNWITDRRAKLLNAKF